MNEDDVTIRLSRQFASFDIIGLDPDDNRPDKDDEYVIMIDRTKPKDKYDIPPLAPLFHNIYCGKDKEFI